LGIPAGHKQKRFTMNDVLIMACFHEAGHAVSAYNFGYSCDKIIVDETGNGLAIINYRDDEDIAISVLYDKPLDEYAVVNPEKKHSIAKKVCRILISGQISEYILTHPLRSETDIVLKQTGTDFLKVRHITEKYKLNLQDEINGACAELQSEENWKLVRILVYCLICKTPLQLNTFEIASVFENFRKTVD
jgi:hypothetical protein